MAVAIVVVALISLTGCQRARLGARCHTTDFGDDGGAWVLQCRNGRWVRALTKADAARIILSAQARSTTTTTAPPTTTTTLPPTTTTVPAPVHDGSAPGLALPVFTAGTVYPGVTLKLEDWKPSISTHDGGDWSPGLVGPDVGEAFVMLNTSLYCDGASPASPCADVSLRQNLNLSIVDVNGHDYPYTTRPQANPDLLSATATDALNGPVQQRVWGYSSFAIDASVPG
jgi:hypothetical protein